MTAIPKAFAMANPKHVAACVTTVAGVISSKFAVDIAAKKISEHDTEIKKTSDG